MTKWICQLSWHFANPSVCKMSLQVKIFLSASRHVKVGEPNFYKRTT